MLILSEKLVQGEGWALWNIYPLNPENQKRKNFRERRFSMLVDIYKLILFLQKTHFASTERSVTIQCELRLWRGEIFNIECCENPWKRSFTFVGIRKNTVCDEARLASRTPATMLLPLRTLGAISRLRLESRHATTDHLSQQQRYLDE